MAKKHASCLLLFFWSCSVLALTTPTGGSLKNAEISAAGGPNWTRASNAYLVISPYETNSVWTRPVSNTLLWKLGIGYYFFEEKLKERAFFNKLLLELNVYRSWETLSGTVWQYELPQFNNYSFRAPFTSTRAMLDLKPSLFRWKQLSLYPILGMGIAWNNLAYHETITEPGVDPDSTRSLAGNTHSNFAYDVGAGLSLALKEHLSISLEYLYTHLGNTSPTNTSTTTAPLLSAPTFTLHSQSVLLGLSWKI